MLHSRKRVIPSGSWDYEELFGFLIKKCNEIGSKYCISIDEAAKYKKGTVGKGFGLASFCKKFIPEYERKNPGYIFYIKNEEKYDNRYLCCEKVI